MLRSSCPGSRGDCGDRRAAGGVTVGVIVTQTGDDGPTNAASCSDVEFIGVAGSGQRDGGDSAEDQMDVEIVPDDRPEKSDARPQTSSTSSRDTPEASDNST